MASSASNASEGHEAHRIRWLLGLSVAGAVIFGPGLVEWGRLRLRQHRLDRQLAQLEARRESLSRERARLQSDPAYVEGLIRSTFKVAQPGEVVVPIDSAPSTDRTR